MVFDRKWFAKHQRGLLFLCNNFVLKYWFRWVLRLYGFMLQNPIYKKEKKYKYNFLAYRLRWILRIHRDVPFKKKIIRLEPNCYTWETGNENEFTTDFRTHAKFSKRIRYAFWYIWATLHYLDSLFNYYGLELNFGYDTFYPDAHTEINSCDGYVECSGTNATWASLQSGNGTIGNDSATAVRAVVLETGTTAWTSIGRGFVFFDTSSLDDAATIDSAVASYYYNYKSDGLSCTPSFTIYNTTSTDTTAISTGAYQTAGTTRYSDEDMGYASFTTGAYRSLNLNSAGLSAISKTGLTRHCIRSNYDATNSEPSYTASREVNMWFRSADQSGTTTDPKLVVTYSTPSTSKQYIY